MSSKRIRLLYSFQINEDQEGASAFESAQFYYPKIKKINNLYEVTHEKDALFKFALSFDE